MDRRERAELDRWLTTDPRDRDDDEPDEEEDDEDDE